MAKVLALSNASCSSLSILVKFEGITLSRGADRPASNDPNALTAIQAVKPPTVGISPAVSLWTTSHRDTRTITNERPQKAVRWYEFETILHSDLVIELDLTN